MALSDLIVRIREDFSGKGFDEAQAKAKELNARIAEVSAGLAVAGLAAAKAGITISSAFAAVGSAAATTGQAFAQVASVGSAAVVGSLQALSAAIASVTGAATGLSSAVGGTASATNILLDTYRAARIILSPTPFTLISVAAGIATEKLIELFSGLILEQNQLIQSSARTAAALNQSFSSVFQAAAATRIAGVDLSIFKSLDTLAENVASLRNVQDPVERAAQAMLLFGNDAKQAQAALALLNVDIRQAVDSSKELAEAMDPAARIAIDRASSAFDNFRKNLSQIQVAQRSFVEDLKQTVAILGANLFGGVLSGLQAVGKGIQDLQALLSRIPGFGSSPAQTRDFSAAVPSLAEIQRRAAGTGLGQVLPAANAFDPVAKQLVAIQEQAVRAQLALKGLGVVPIEKLRADLAIAQERLAEVAKAADGSADSFSNLKNAEIAVGAANDRLNSALQATISDFGQIEDALKKAFAGINVTPIADLRKQLTEAEGALRLITAASGESNDGLLDVKNATDAVAAAQKRLTDALGTTRTSLDQLAQADIGNRVKEGFNLAVKAVQEFILASEPIGKKLPLEASALGSAIFLIAEHFDEFANKAIFDTKAVTDQLEILRLQLEAVGKVARVDIEVNQAKVPRPGVLETGDILNRGGEQSQLQLREAANQAGNDLKKLVELRDRQQATQADVIKQQKIYQDAESRAAGITVATVNTQVRAFQTLRGEIERSVKTLSSSIANVIVQGGSLADVFTGVAQTISTSIIQFAINQGLKLLGDELQKLGGILGSLGRQLSSIFGSIGGGAAQAVSQGAQSGISTGGSAAGAVASGALGGISGAVTAVSSVITAVTSVLSFLQGRRMEQDIGRIEVTSREIFSQVTNIWNDNKGYYAGIFGRMGEIWTTLRHIDEGLAQVDIGKRTTAAGITVAGDVVIQDPVGDPDTLMTAMVRRLKQKDRAFAIA